MRVNVPMGNCLFPRLIRGFDDLPAAVRAAHGEADETRLAGSCDVERGAGILARAFAAAASLPRAGRDVALRVVISRDARGEEWTREFAGRAMRSSLRAHENLLEESLGPVRFRFALRAHDGAIEWRVAAVRVLGVPLPVSWFSGVAARESAVDGRYCFDVRAAMPLAGLIVHYRGLLDAER
jgi:Domain of unknown function (DUF4166)